MKITTSPFKYGDLLSPKCKHLKTEELEGVFQKASQCIILILQHLKPTGSDIVQRILDILKFLWVLFLAMLDGFTMWLNLLTKQYVDTFHGPLWGALPLHSQHQPGGQLAQIKTLSNVLLALFSWILFHSQTPSGEPMDDQISQDSGISLLRHVSMKLTRTDVRSTVRQVSVTCPAASFLHRCLHSQDFVQGLYMVKTTNCEIVLHAVHWSFHSLEILKKYVSTKILSSKNTVKDHY